MKRGFTLVEMLIVVVVLVTLMTITFRLSSLGDEQERRNRTISRMQRVENCLSGYYAAFGTYPPVRLHGSRNYNLQVNYIGMQDSSSGERKLSLDWYSESDSDHGIGSTSENRDWRQVRAACMAQPVAARFPYPDGYNEVIKAKAELAREQLAEGDDDDTSAEHAQMVNAGWDDGYTENPGRHDLNEAEWCESQLFEFGLMSYLLPRYLVMMNGDVMFFRDGKQWQANNSLPFDPIDGGRISWSELHEYAQKARSNDKEAIAHIANIPSQSACARWMPNLEGCCIAWHVKDLFGVDIHSTDDHLKGSHGIYAPGGSQSPQSSSQYALDVATVTDGWYYELYYYSPAPYQSYTLWSSGPNKRTFPPWASREDFDAKENRCIGVWINDDIIHMSN